MQEATNKKGENRKIIYSNHDLSKVKFCNLLLYTSRSLPKKQILCAVKKRFLMGPSVRGAEPESQQLSQVQ